FFNNSTNESVRAALVGVNSRLFAVAPASWYCRVTKAFGPLVEKGNPELYQTNYAASINTYETSMWNAALKCLGNTNTILGGKDAYDYLGWGDNPHYFESAGRLLWNGNYYDLPHLMVQHFARAINSNETHAYSILDYFHAHTTHIQDLHTTHFDPSNMSDGACRYCPPTNHIGQDALEPAVMNQTSHHKTQSLFEMYYLLGEERALDAALKGVKWIKTFGTGEVNAFNLNCYARRPAHIFNTLIAGYKYNFDAQNLSKLTSYLTALRTTIGTGGIDKCEPTLDQRWLVGLLTEAMVDAYPITGNPLWISTVKQIVDSSAGTNSNNAYANAFLSSYYNNKTYLGTALTRMSIIGNGLTFGHHEKDYAEKSRSILMAFTYFAIPESLEISAEKFSNPSGMKQLSIHAAPNPFNGTELSVCLNLPSATRVKIKLISPDGRVLNELKLNKMAAGAHRMGLMFKGKNNHALSSGMYVLRLETQDRAVSSNVVYFK
ncbi:MAG: T9SS type A sorting domain-containing protein, partial [Fibrobacteres bacterium]|nr:T9SS type A sorting domain-containing protein [Fibrobacterota bacterium]